MKRLNVTVVLSLAAVIFLTGCGSGHKHDRSAKPSAEPTPATDSGNSKSETPKPTSLVPPTPQPTKSPASGAPSK